MKLQLHIADLLYKYDCVVVPNFGGFVGSYASATVHSVQHSFEPPFKKILFNKNLTQNDGLLANTIALKEKCSFEQALALIEEEVAVFTAILLKNEKIELQKIGTLSLDVENNIQFKQNTTVNYLLDSYGLTSFYSPPIQRQSKTAKLEKEFIDRLPIKESVKSKKRNTKIATITSLSLLLIIGLLISPISNNKALSSENYAHLLSYFIPTKGKSLYSQRIQAVKIDSTSFTFENLMVDNFVDTALFLGSSNERKIVVKTDADTSFAETVSVPELKKQGRYYLVAGCFKEIENAQKFLKDLVGKGFKASIIGKNKSGLHRVSYSSFEDQQEARAEMNEIRKKGNEVWMLN